MVITIIIFTFIWMGEYKRITKIYNKCVVAHSIWSNVRPYFYINIHPGYMELTLQYLFWCKNSGEPNPFIRYIGRIAVNVYYSRLFFKKSNIYNILAYWTNTGESLLSRWFFVYYSIFTLSVNDKSGFSRMITSFWNIIYVLQIWHIVNHPGIIQMSSTTAL